MVIGLFIVGLLLLALLAVWIGRVFPAAATFHLPWWINTLGPFLVLLGAVLIGWSIQVQFTIGKGTPAPMVPTRVLVTQGPYAWTRNPMTLGAFLFFLGIGNWLGSGLVILLTLFVFSALLTMIHFFETSELTDRFGAEYLEYKKRTPFFFPLFFGKK